MTDIPAASDTPVKTPTFPPPSKLDQAKGFIGDLARPFAIYVTAASAAASVVILAIHAKTPDLSASAIFEGAVFTGVGALYGAKAWENAQQAKQQATVQVAQATNGPPVVP